MCLMCGAHIRTGSGAFGGNRMSAYKAHTRRCERATPADRAAYVRSGRWPKAIKPHPPAETIPEQTAPTPADD